ncbi:MAG TPA: glycosyltransferase [Gaiellaceae bacterium]|nr:glycosyltransferase [Gaiellaceae bacterium]
MEILCVTWDGAGNLPPLLGTARRLAAAGHSVCVLGHRRLQEWVEDTGSAFCAYAASRDFDSLAGLPPEEELRVCWEEIWFAASIAEDVSDRLEREPPDVVVADNMLAGAFCAAEHAGVPVVALFHQPWSLFHAGPLAEMWSGAAPLVASMRAALGLPAVDGPQALWEGVPSVVAGTPELGLPLPIPANVRHVGWVAEHPPHPPPPPPWLPPGSGPLVVVTHSTSQMGQASVFETVLEGLAELPVRVLVTTGPAIDPASLELPANAAAVGYVAHELLLGEARLVVAHAGHGSTLTALAHGVPLVCLPRGRDQFFLAQRVEELGVGLQLPPGSSPADVSAAVRRVLDDPAFATAARGFRERIAAHGGAEAAARIVASAGGVARPGARSGRTGGRLAEGGPERGARGGRLD